MDNEIHLWRAGNYQHGIEAMDASETWAVAEKENTEGEGIALPLACWETLGPLWLGMNLDSEFVIASSTDFISPTAPLWRTQTDCSRLSFLSAVLQRDD